MSRTKTNQAQLTLPLPILMDLVSVGDGTYKAVPRKLAAGGDNWIKASEAARLLNVSPKTIYRLADNGHLRDRKPTPRKRQINLESVEAFRKGIEGNPDFWNNQALERTQ
jgi:excisionase family DNA binding protein